MKEETKFLKYYSSIFSNSEIDITSKNILILLIHLWKYYKKNVIISIDKIAGLTSISRRTVIRKLELLQELNLISRKMTKEENNNTKNESNQYFLNEETINKFFQDEIFKINKATRNTNKNNNNVNLPQYVK